ncbi:MAG TPA: CapA family protein [Acidimicrobiales bacterium]|nr:CapA family protein [Acidimicrobiales bacterium]
MSGRHLRRPRAWWFRRAVIAVGVLALGAGVGAGIALLSEGDGGDVAALGDGSARLVPRPGPITIALGGEVQAGDVLGGRLFAGQDPIGPFADVLAEADLAVVGLSAAVVDEDPADPGGAAWVPATVLDGLETAGADVISLANDRALDLGPAGRDRTLGLVAGRRAAVAGIGVDEHDAYAPAVRTVGGARVAVLAATQDLDPARIATDTAGPAQPGVASAKRVDRLVAEVEATAEEADVVVVYLHWGQEGETCPGAGQRELAAALIEAGADVVAGPGAGGVQGAGRSGPAVVAYGLGTLVGDGAGEAGTLAVDVEDGEVTSWRWVAGRVVGGVAEPVDADEAVTADLDARQACAGLGP